MKRPRLRIIGKEEEKKASSKAQKIYSTKSWNKTSQPKEVNAYENTRSLKNTKDNGPPPESTLT